MLLAKLNILLMQNMNLRGNKMPIKKSLKYFAGIVLVAAPFLGTNAALQMNKANASELEQKVNEQTKVVSKAPEVEDIIGENSQKNRDNINYTKLYEMIARHEGVKNEAYFDTKGILTIGAGFNLKRADAKEKITSLGLDYHNVCNKKQRLSNEQIYRLMKKDVETAISDAKNYVGKSWDSLNPKAQEVLIDMSYNLGSPRLSKFKKLRAALINRNYQEAAKEMKNSKWYSDVGNRSRELISIMNSINK